MSEDNPRYCPGCGVKEERRYVCNDCDGGDAFVYNGCDEVFFIELAYYDPSPPCGAVWPQCCENCVGSCGIEEYIEAHEGGKDESPSDGGS